MLADDLSTPAAYLNFESNCSPHHKLEFHNSPHFKVSVVHRAPYKRATIICWELQHLYDETDNDRCHLQLSVFSPFVHRLK